MFAGRLLNVLVVCSEFRITRLSPNKKSAAIHRNRFRVLARVKIESQGFFEKYFSKASISSKMPVAFWLENALLSITDKFNYSSLCGYFTDSRNKEGIQPGKFFRLDSEKQFEIFAAV